MHLPRPRLHFNTDSAEAHLPKVVLVLRMISGSAHARSSNQIKCVYSGETTNGFPGSLLQIAALALSSAGSSNTRA